MVTQCVNLDEAGAYTLTGLARIASPEGSASLDVVVDAYASLDCDGSSLANGVQEASTGDTAGGWAAFEVDGATPSGARSALISFVATADPTDEARVEIDNVFIESSSSIFKDDFED